MRMETLLFLFLTVLCVPGFSTQALAWGPLGHRMTTETAALLLEKSRADDWGPLLARHRFELGYYSIVPDAIYRHKDGKNGILEAPTHYFDLDIALGSVVVTPELEAKLEKIPWSFEAAQKYLEETIGHEKMLSAGTAPWRVEQFQELAWQNLKNVKVVKGGYQQGTKAEGDLRKVYRGMYYLGVMSHYSSDAAMPYHASSDWNGWATGQGGIHFFFETDCANALEPGLSTLVFEEAQKHQKEWLAFWHAPSAAPAGVMLRLFLDSATALPKLARLDKEKAVTQASDVSKQQPATRRPAIEVCKYFQPLLVERLAKASVMTAYLWDSVLPHGVDFSKSGSVQFSDFEFDPGYVEPNYGAPSFLKFKYPWEKDTH